MSEWWWCSKIYMMVICMVLVIKDKGEDEPNVLIDFMKISEVVKNIAARSTWTLVHIDGVGTLPNSESIVSFQNYVKKNNVKLNWNKLVLILVALEQIYELEIVSDNNAISCIYCMDSSFWEISTKDVSVMHCIKNNFLDVEIR